MDVPDVSYAWSGDVAIAYQALGEGPADLVLLPFLSNIYTLWDAPRFAEFGRRLATGRRLIVVNPRGVGLSDRPRGFTVESRMDDIRVVMDDVGSERTTLLGWAEQSATCVVFAATYPDRVDRLILSNPWGRGFHADQKEAEQALRQAHEDRRRWGERGFLEALGAGINPQWAEDREYLDWFVWHHRLTASPAAWIEFRRMQIDLDIRDVLPAIRVPTLVISKEFMREECERVAEAIPDCELVVVPGRGGAMQENDHSIEAVEAFLAGERQAAIPDSVLATILFTDLVGSTERVAALGDAAWRDLLERHDSVVRRALARFRGEERDTAGDGFFATFDGPARAIRCAEAVVEDVRTLGLDVRAGIHTGECELHDGKIAGLAVSIGARIASAATGGEVLVSQTVKDLVAGSGIELAERGERELKGVPGTWRLYAVGGD